MQSSQKQSAPLTGALQLKRFLSIKEVQTITGKSRATIVRWTANGHLPPSCAIGPNSVGWPEEAIAEWRENLLKGGSNV